MTAESSGSGTPGSRRPDVDRQVARQGLCRDRHEGHLQGRGRRRRGEVRTTGSRRLPARSDIVRAARRAHPEGYSAGRPSGHRQDAAGARSSRRGRRAVLLDLRRRVRRDVRGRWGGARARFVRAGKEGGALHHLHRRAGCARPQPRPRRVRRLRRTLAASCGLWRRSNAALLSSDWGLGGPRSGLRWHPWAAFAPSGSSAGLC